MSEPAYNMLNNAIQAMSNKDKEITDLRSRLADAQARAERAEGVSSKLRWALESQPCTCLDGDPCVRCVGLSEWKVDLTPAPQGRTDGERVVQCDQRTFPTAQDAALHLLWVIQRLSFYEKEREGQPCDGFRIRQCIIEARKLLDSIGYESTVFGNAVATAPEVKGGGE